MPEDPERTQRLFEEEFRSTLEAAYQVAAQNLVIGIEAREMRLEAYGDARSKAAARACIARACRR